MKAGNLSFLSPMKNKTGQQVSVLVNVLCCLLCQSHTLDTLQPGDSLHNNQTLVSAAGMFELGFFTSDELTNYYLGIWFKTDETKKPVWVANRDSPLIDPSAVLTIRQDGNMVISDSRLLPIIINLGSLATSSNTTAKLLDYGNLILLQGEVIVWQSFDYPTDTFLPGMKLGVLGSGTDQVKQPFLVSWLSPTVPTSGAFALGVDPVNRSQYNLCYRSAYGPIGFWDGHNFRFWFQSSSDSQNFTFISNNQDVYITFDNKGNTTSSWFVLTSTGNFNEHTMTEHGISIVNHSLCDSLSVVSSNLCFNKLPLNCKYGDTFLDIRGSMPVSAIVNQSTRLSISDCEIMCRENCSCTAFASADVSGIGCELYYGVTSDLFKITGEGNNTIYVRGSKSDQRTMRRLRWAIAVPVVLLSLFALCCLCRRKCNIIGTNRGPDGVIDIAGLLTFKSSSDVTSTEDSGNPSGLELGTRTDHELPLLSFSSIARATDNFSAENMLGEGGYGPVYKGNLSGQEIAVKRLSKRSGQGLEEFKNEVKLICKLQHRNLVKLLACCIEHEEKILIYEHMPNKSLDSFIFDPVRRTLVDWRQRLRIIEGIAQGLLYLHKYSRLRIIHRDLKPSNILLDGDMNPKISDFGMARIFSDNESRGRTRKVAGTFGYMSPEYGVHGFFSVKSDVYSFGVILLEIVSGRKSVDFGESGSSSSLLGHAWELWEDGRCIEFMDPVLADSFLMKEVMVCIQVGLLCVQDNAEDRPSMLDVVSILNNEGAVLSTPKQPVFSTNLCLMGSDPSLNSITFSAIEAR